MAIIYLDLCLSDIPKEQIKTATNGKKYLKAYVRPRKNPDEDGYDHYVAVAVPKDQRQEGDKPLFFGRAQEKHFDNAPHVGGTPFNNTSSAPAPQRPVDVDNDLPF